MRKVLLVRKNNFFGNFFVPYFLEFLFVLRVTSKYLYKIGYESSVVDELWVAREMDSQKAHLAHNLAYFPLIELYIGYALLINKCYGE